MWGRSYSSAPEGRFSFWESRTGCWGSCQAVTCPSASGLGQSQPCPCCHFQRWCHRSQPERLGLLSCLTQSNLKPSPSPTLPASSAPHSLRRAHWHHFQDLSRSRSSIRGQLWPTLHWMAYRQFSLCQPVHLTRRYWVYLPSGWMKGCWHRCAHSRESCLKEHLALQLLCWCVASLVQTTESDPVGQLYRCRCRFPTACRFRSGTWSSSHDWSAHSTSAALAPTRSRGNASVPGLLYYFDFVLSIWALSVLWGFLELQFQWEQRQALAWSWPIWSHFECCLGSSTATGEVEEIQHLGQVSQVLSSYSITSDWRSVLHRLFRINGCLCDWKCRCRYCFFGEWISVWCRSRFWVGRLHLTGRRSDCLVTHVAVKLIAAMTERSSQIGLLSVLLLSFKLCFSSFSDFRDCSRCKRVLSVISSFLLVHHSLDWW